MLFVQQSQDIQRRDCSTARVQSMYLNRRQFCCACALERVLPRDSCDHYCAHSWSLESCSIQIYLASAADNHEQRVLRFMKNVSIFLEQKLCIGIDICRSPEALGTCVMDCASADDNGIGGRSQ